MVHETDGRGEMMIRGDRLSTRQIEQVLAAYVHRHSTIGRNKRYANDRAWRFDHAFYFLSDGSRLMANHKYCEPAFMAENA